jgi:hypothetical protein
VKPRALLLIAGGACAILALVLWGALRAPDNDRQTFVATTYSSGPGGAKALYLLLEQSNLTVSRIRTFPPDKDSDGAVLWILCSTALPPIDADAAIGFVKEGGTLVAPPDLVADLFARAGVTGAHAEKSACGDKEPCWVKTRWGGGLKAPQASLRHLAGVDPEEAYASVHGEHIVAAYALGDGHLVSLGALDSLRNQDIGDGGAGAFWVHLAAELGEKHTFDEVHTGYGDLNLITLIWRAPYRWAALDLAFVLALGVWGFGSRTRRADADPPARRRETKDHVQAVADWWGRSGDVGLPLSALLTGLDARAAGRLHARGGRSFVAWASSVRPELGARATAAWEQAERLLSLPRRGISTREVVTTAAELRAIEREVFQC